MALHPRDMGVAKNGDTIGLEIKRAARGARDSLRRLQRQAINQIKIERTDAESARRVGAGLRLLVRLLAPDCFLHQRLEVLNAKADPSDAHYAQGFAAIGRQ